MPFLRYALLFALVCSSAAATSPEAADPNEARFLDLYFTAARAERSGPSDVTMDVEVEASLPKMGKKGSATARRSVSATGAIEYSEFRFEGDATIKNEVIARYFQGETEASARKMNIGITPENYKFNYAGLHGEGDWQLHLFQVTPRKKSPGLFQGWIWVEAKTNLAVREQGELVKSPSIFLRSVEFVRDFVIRNGSRVPAGIDVVTQTRLVGAAHLKMIFKNVRPSK